MWGFAVPAAAQKAEKAPDIRVIVLGTGGSGIPDANVSLWQCAYDRQMGQYKNIKPISGCKTLTISCGFSGMQPGLYNVTAGKEGHTGFSVVELAPGNGVKNVNVIIDEHKMTMRSPPRFIPHGVPPPPPPPPQVPGVSSYPVPELPVPAKSWLEPVPGTDYYGHRYNITSSYYVTQPDGTRLYVDDIRYNDSIKGIVTADDYYAIQKGDDGYWHYVNFYTGSLSGKAGIDKPSPSDSAGIYEGPPTSYSLTLFLPYVPRPAYMDPTSGLSGISGTITNKSGSGVAGASVTVYHATFNRLTGEYLNLSLALTPANPQLTRSDRDSMPGVYAVPYLPPGTYRVVAEKDGHTASRIVNVDPKKGTSTSDIVI